MTTLALVVLGAVLLGLALYIERKGRHLQTLLSPDQRAKRGLISNKAAFLVPAPILVATAIAHYLANHWLLKGAVVTAGLMMVIGALSRLTLKAMHQQNYPAEYITGMRDLSFVVGLGMPLFFMAFTVVRRFQ